MLANREDDDRSVTVSHTRGCKNWKAMRDRRKTEQWQQIGTPKYVLIVAKRIWNKKQSIELKSNENSDETKRKTNNIRFA